MNSIFYLEIEKKLPITKEEYNIKTEGETIAEILKTVKTATGGDFKLTRRNVVLYATLGIIGKSVRCGQQWKYPKGTSDDLVALWFIKNRYPTPLNELAEAIKNSGAQLFSIFYFLWDIDCKLNDRLKLKKTGTAECIRAYVYLKREYFRHLNRGYDPINIDIKFKE